MFKKLARSLVVNTLAVWLVTRLLSSGFQVTGGPSQLVTAAVAITLANLILKPLVNLIMLPINLLTLGLFRWLGNVAVIYLVTRLVPSVKITPFIIPPLTIGSLQLPTVSLSQVGALLAVSLTISLVFSFLHWLFSDN